MGKRLSQLGLFNRQKKEAVWRRVAGSTLTLAGERGEKAGGQDGYRSVESHCSSNLPPFSGSRNSALEYAILCP